MTVWSPSNSYICLFFFPPCLQQFQIQRGEGWYLPAPSTYSFHYNALHLSILWISVDFVKEINNSIVFSKRLLDDVYWTFWILCSFYLAKWLNCIIHFRYLSFSCKKWYHRQRTLILFWLLFSYSIISATISRMLNSDFIILV